MSNPKKRKKQKDPKPPKGKEGYRLIWTAYITLRNGKRLYASQCGKKAFPIWVKD